MKAAHTSVLSLSAVTVAYRLQSTWAPVVRNVSLNILPQQVYGLVGESGSGKTTLALAAMQALPRNGRITSGDILLDGESLLGKSVPQMRSIWGIKMNMVPQDPGASLNPALTIGEQIAEISRRHEGLSVSASRQRAIDLLREVRLGDPERVASRYPHQLSGGQQQRTLIAMALSTNPRLLVLDEPTTNLDVTTEAVVLDLVKDLIRKHQAATLYVTHNLGVVAQMCDRTAVMYAGEVVEDAAVGDLFRRPLHPYTLELLRCVPRVAASQQIRLHTIQGTLPNRAHTLRGCIFADRCPFVLDHCRTAAPPFEEAHPGRWVRCHRWRDMEAGDLTIPEDPIPANQANTRSTDTLLHLDRVTKRFSGGRGHEFTAVDGISLDLAQGQTLGVVGESGSGKTTLARCIVGLVERTSGEMTLVPMDLPPRLLDRPPSILKRLQMVFQNPDESLNPYQTVGEALRRPLRVLAKVDPQTIETRIRDLLRAVHLGEEYANRYPSELSGGEKQRVAIARAFASEPELIIADESVSALDVSVQAAILNLLSELKNTQQTSYVFISHDLAVVGYLADVIAVVYLGQIVEIVPRAQFFEAPMHPYTEALLSAIPVLDPGASHERIRLESDIPSQSNRVTGCRFHTRCPRKIGAICEQTEPPFVDAGNGQFIRCHIPLDELSRSQIR